MGLTSMETGREERLNLELFQKREYDFARIAQTSLSYLGDFLFDKGPKRPSIRFHSIYSTALPCLQHTRREGMMLPR
jgi:hypothetical protein